jgi:hypothetical protein
MNCKYLANRLHITIIIFLLLASTFSPIRVTATTNQAVTYYKYGTYQLDKSRLIKNIRNNVASFLTYQCDNEGWSNYYVEEFKNAYFRIMELFDDPKNPNRFYSNEFGTMTDNEGELDNTDMDDYWYDKKGKRITGEEYRKLKEKKKKDYHDFEANREVISYINQIADLMVKKLNEESKDNNYGR